MGIGEKCNLLDALPKFVEHRSAEHLVRAERDLYGLTERDVVWHGFSVAFDASVEELWAALAHGGSSEGAPGLRLSYNPDFYAAYVRDPDGNKLAVVCRGFTAPQG